MSLYLKGSNALTPPNEELIKHICEHGLLYSPVKLRYNFECSVVCDRCYKRNLNECVSYENYDLCKNCVDAVRQIYNFTNPIQKFNPKELLNEKINKPSPTVNTTTATTNNIKPVPTKPQDEEPEEEPTFNLFD